MNAFHGLISWLDMAKESISELEDLSKETSKTKKQREKRLGKKKREQNTQQLWDNDKRCNIYMKMPRETMTEQVCEAIMTENFPQVNVRY